MKICEVFPDDPLLEANLKKTLHKAAVAGAFSAGLFGAHGIDKNYGMTLSPSSSIERTVEPQDFEDLAQFKMHPELDPEHAGELLSRKKGDVRDPEQAGNILSKAQPGKPPAGVHANFPTALWNQSTQNADKKMQAFVFTFAPLIDQANNKILADRRYLLSIINPTHHLDDDERAWVESKMSAYYASNVAELVIKMDIVPKNMALAQGALESGWGSSSIARRSNAFFGMISGVGGYSGYKSAQDSVTDYIHNLNTHPAYKEFRQARAAARSNRQRLNSFQLVGHLSKYSERGQDYIKHVKQMMAAPYIKDLDENRFFTRY